uniref:Uncharacterized protein n=1 Tax=Romanomermis culicivorax TaxID=13658 RepID=A0A915HUB0_ROMCU
MLRKKMFGIPSDKTSETIDMSLMGNCQLANCSLDIIKEHFKEEHRSKIIRQNNCCRHLHEFNQTIGESYQSICLSLMDEEDFLIHYIYCSRLGHADKPNKEANLLAIELLPQP